ncbi:MAG: sulfite exporter TauE/SafE family protein [Proteobacteria bacterium]|nr:sulfite exporter TauE/SafE family protein [Pseudomonadota bacterium]
MDPLTIGLLCGAAFATSVLSAVIGMAGGIVLLAVMLLFFDPIVAIPLHGVVQLVSNSTRSIVQRRHLAWGIVRWYALPLLPLALAGVYVALSIPAVLGKALIGAFVLVATLRPGWLRIRPPGAGGVARRFALLGSATGFLSSLIGATGPLIAPFFLDLGLSRQSVVGTKAACQTLGHMAKIAAFGWVGFAYLEHAGLLALMSAMVIAGTALGSRLLERVDEVLFTRLYRTVLTLIALRLLASALIERLA